MEIKYLTLFKDFYKEFVNTSIIKNAINKGIVNIEVIDLKNEVKDGRVDDKVVGGGKGNLIRYDVISDTLNKYKSDKSKIVLVSPKGVLFKQGLATKLSKEEDLIFICPHFEGVDERVVDECDYVISIGDYILTGGELASQVITDSVVRLIDGVINKESLKDETFNNDLLEYPQYTLPRTYNNKAIPDVYFCGNHKVIEEYNIKRSLLITKENRPDLYKKHTLSKKEEKILEKCDENYINEAIRKSKKEH